MTWDTDTEVATELLLVMWLGNCLVHVHSNCGLLLKLVEPESASDFQGRQAQQDGSSEQTR